jgi:flagellar basal body rod protein FlgC
LSRSAKFSIAKRVVLEYQRGAINASCANMAQEKLQKTARDGTYTRKAQFFKVRKKRGRVPRPHG